MIDDEAAYFSFWVEEGWDDQNNCATSDYRYYEKLIIKDFKGHVTSEMVAALNKHPDGTWWLS